MATHSALPRVLTGAAALCALLLGACSGDGYALQGRVIRGDASYALIVDESDPRLEEGEPVPGVAVELIIDPSRLKRELAGQAVSDDDGAVSLAVDKFGAGWMEYDAAIRATRKGFVPALGYFELPPKNSVLLVVMAEGEGDAGFEMEDPAWSDGEDWKEDLRRYGY